MKSYHETLENGSISIASGADDKFAMGLAITLYSALANLETNRTIDIYIIDGGISKENKQKLIQVLSNNKLNVNIKWLKPDLGLLNGVKVSGAFSIATYFRLLLPELLPKQVEKVIYLDSDLLVQGNLEKLWEKELDDFPALAVQDYLFPWVSNGLQDTYQELGLASDTPYCNAGVMLMNLKQWRAEALANKVLEYSHKYHDTVYVADQDGINALIADRWKLLDPKWNVQIFGVDSSAIKLPYKPTELIRDGFILHFTTKIKPWHPTYRRAGGERFAYYLKKSNWLSNLEYIKWFTRVRLPQMCIYSLAQINRRLKAKTS
ncbi:MAG: glycosyltransferase family 8 protein [Fischerella sp.]|jgi:lipopolysaccharide biosynthesis glycosyltransferase|uniref:glycosyltransferase family 8 protein n=1 Tax=Fischerella sp. TaxID=1191 RepID=UPI0017C1B7DD|nr:glycosyltransferase family 8 protein [Fischerella sp.]NWF61052.1 glycosyltransferase family 8 protein [Fischerella sp.]